MPIAIIPNASVVVIGKCVKSMDVDRIATSVANNNELTNEERIALLQDLLVIDNNRRIVERLKKRIEELDSITDLYKELKKILSNEN